MLHTACGLQPQPPAASVGRSALMRTVQLLGADALLVQVPGSSHGPQLRYGCCVINQNFLFPETVPWDPEIPPIFSPSIKGIEVDREKKGFRLSL